MFTKQRMAENISHFAAPRARGTGLPQIFLKIRWNLNLNARRQLNFLNKIIFLDKFSPNIYLK